MGLTSEEEKGLGRCTTSSKETCTRQMCNKGHPRGARVKAKRHVYYAH